MVPFKLTVCATADLPIVLEKDPSNYVLSLLNATEAFEFHSPKIPHLLINMDNITYGATGWRTPTLQQIIDILKFTENLGDAAHLVIHSSQDFGRSSAVAIGVLCQHQVSPAQSIELVALQCPGMDPNELILRHFDAALALKLALLDSYKSWASQQMGRLSNTVPKHSGAELERNAREYYSQLAQRMPINNMDLL
jgi:predicted protein tyrosine phosphatase